ncbi:MAG: RNA polymerase sigma factor [Deltaproteobacteria bacterium]|nr:RNA polymerase sigma factor [Deltaproteobacteria bacterium]
MDNSSREILVEEAKTGNRAALESLILSIQDRIYGLALRMLWHPEDAEDATQEILIKIITHLDSFRSECAFTTWVYRVATNHLLTTHKRKAERKELTFKDYELRIDQSVAVTSSNAAMNSEQSLIIQEIMIACTLGMLLCMSRELRLSYILGDISEISGEQAATILRISPAAFRKRLSLARLQLRDFMTNKCGLVNPDNSCRCSGFVHHVIKRTGNNTDNFMFAEHSCRRHKNVVTSEQLQEMQELQRIITIYRSHPDYAAPEKFVEGIKELIDSGKYKLFGGTGRALGAASATHMPSGRA